MAAKKGRRTDGGKFSALAAFHRHNPEFMPAFVEALRSLLNTSFQTSQPRRQKQLEEKELPRLYIVK